MFVSIYRLVDIFNKITRRNAIFTYKNIILSRSIGPIYNMYRSCTCLICIDKILPSSSVGQFRPDTFFDTIRQEDRKIAYPGHVISSSAFSSLLKVWKRRMVSNRCRINRLLRYRRRSWLLRSIEQRIENFRFLTQELLFSKGWRKLVPSTLLSWISAFLC